MLPAHNAMIVCHDSRISGSAAMADSSLCHNVIQSCASLRASGMSGVPVWRGPASLDLPPRWFAAPWSVTSASSLSCPVLSKPASITMPHSSSSQAEP